MLRLSSCESAPSANSVTLPVPALLIVWLIVRSSDPAALPSRMRMSSPAPPVVIVMPDRASTVVTSRAASSEILMSPVDVVAARLLTETSMSELSAVASPIPVAARRTVVPAVMLDVSAAVMSRMDPDVVVMVAARSVVFVVVSCPSEMLPSASKSISPSAASTVVPSLIVMVPPLLPDRVSAVTVIVPPGPTRSPSAPNNTSCSAVIVIVAVVVVAAMRPLMTVSAAIGALTPS